ncbi:MAG: hypothetical protein ACD_73C00440G0003 [uncultured bacterium]|nr:MAG: hypothetical protein ACD_73C00440G0003 [uncultured bacterium]
MKIYSSVIFLVFLLFQFLIPCLAVGEEENCVLDKETAINALLNPKDPNIKEVFPPKKYLDGRRLTESLLMKDGTKIIYDVGGCAHYSYSFTYENIKDISAMDNKNILKLALSLLRKTPSLKEINVLPYTLEQAQTKEIKLTNNTLDLPCGDAVCSVEIKGPHSLTISYDFPL